MFSFNEPTCGRNVLKLSLIRFFDVRKEREKCLIFKILPQFKELLFLFSSDHLFEEENKDRDEIRSSVNDLCY